MGIVEELYNTLQEKLARNDEEGAMSYLRENFKKLPKEMQGEILTRAYVSAMQDEIEQRKTIAGIQERAISALQALEVLKEELEKRKSAM